jgi:hypothetical protein
MLTFCALSCGLLEDRAVAQVVSRRPPTAEARVLASLCEILVLFSYFFGFPLSLSFHRGPPFSYIAWGMNTGSIGGRSSETSSPNTDRNDINVYFGTRHLHRSARQGVVTVLFLRYLPAETSSEAHPASYAMGTGGPFPGVKTRPGRDADHSPHLVLRSKLSRSCTSSSLPCRLHGGGGTAFKLQRS